MASGQVKCVLTPEMTEGPYYLAGEKLRRDITEGKPGARLDLALTVVDASTCRPIKGATVDIWHCDAGGVYSGFGAGASNRTFLRGLQKTDAHGVAHFKTVYPGWYPGRTVHIHVKVHVRGNVVHTGQLFFADATTDAVYRKAPYSKRPNRDPRNSGRLDLRERREAFAAEGQEDESGLPRRHRHGRHALRSSESYFLKTSAKSAPGACNSSMSANSRGEATSR